ncbi:MAG: MIP/aquaporin family protein [Pseudomonadota bacterium]
MHQARKLVAELIGSLFLAGVVIGSGILAQQLSGGNIAVALLGNTAATGAILWVLVATLGPVSGAHFNPAVTLAFFLRGEISVPLAVIYGVIQVMGCVLGAWLAHAMFELPLIQVSETDRSGLAKMLAEGVATFALVFAIFGAIKHAPNAVPAAVALVITAGYWWTASTSFANPAISIARALSDTFAGVRPADLPGFIIAQCLGASLATGCAVFLFPKSSPEDPRTND